MNCPITHTPFNDGDEITSLPCNHLFDTEAINRWVQKKPECPICRFNLKLTTILQEPIPQEPIQQEPIQQEPIQQEPRPQEQEQADQSSTTEGTARSLDTIEEAIPAIPTMSARETSLYSISFDRVFDDEDLQISLIESFIGVFQ